MKKSNALKCYVSAIINEITYERNVVAAFVFNITKV